MKNKSTPVQFILLVVFVDVLFCLLVLVMIRQKSEDSWERFPDLPTPEPTASPDPMLEPLLITPADLVTAAQTFSEPGWYSADDHGAAGVVNVQIGGGQRSFDDWLLSQNVYHFANPEDAQADYAAIVSRLADFSAPAERTLPPLQAAESNLGCIQPASRQSPYCIWTARYGSHVIELLAWLEPEQMPLEDLLSIIIMLDARIADLVSGGGGTP